MITKSTVMGVAKQVSEAWVNHVNTGELRKSSANTKRKEETKNTALYQKLLDCKLNHLPKKEIQTLEPVLWKYAHLFHDEDTNYSSATDVVEHQIELEDTRPIRRPQYRVPFALRGEMKAQVENMLAKGVIRESYSPWSAQAILVPKKTADGKPKYRFCVDFRALKAVTKFDPYPLPIFEESTSTLFGSK